MELFAAIVLFLILTIWLIRQVRKPIGPVGRGIARAMNLGHAAMTEWGLQHLQISRSARMLDIGCGGGRTVQRLAALAPEGKVDGIDYSAASVATSRRTNARAIASGQVQIHLGSVARLPFEGDSFDTVTAVETHYYWPDLAACVREVFRVVKPGGTFALIAETHRRGSLGKLYSLPMALLGAAHLSEDEHRGLLAQAGFTDIALMHSPTKNWICALGLKPRV